MSPLSSTSGTRRTTARPVDRGRSEVRRLLFDRRDLDRLVDRSRGA